MMTISFNGEINKITNNLSLLELLQQKNCNLDFCAVALNRQFIPRIQHATTLLQENDTVEIIQPMQGG